MFPGMICHELSLVVSLHMRPSQARRLHNIRKSYVSPSWVIITPSRASYVYTFRDLSTTSRCVSRPPRSWNGYLLFCALVWTRGRSLASVTALQYLLFSSTTGGGESSIESCGVRGCWVVLCLASSLALFLLSSFEYTCREFKQVFQLTWWCGGMEKEARHCAFCALYRHNTHITQQQQQ